MLAWMGLNKEQKSWVVFLILALLKTRLDIFHMRQAVIGPWRESPLFLHHHKAFHETCTPAGASGNSFPPRTPRTPLPPKTKPNPEILIRISTNILALFSRRKCSQWHLDQQPSLQKSIYSKINVKYVTL